MRSRHLKEFVLEPRGLETEQTTRPRGNPLPPPLGVIHTASRGTLVTQRKGVLIVVPAESCQERPLGKRMKYAREPIAFNDEDLEGMTQPHNDAFGGYSQDKRLHSEKGIDGPRKWIRGNVS